jgi:hypothetical protein
MATPESQREPTLADVLHAVSLLRDEFESLRRITSDEIGSLRHVTLDGFSEMRHLIQALDRDIQGITQWIAGQET